MIKVIKSLEGESYKYLGVLKEKCYRRVRKVLETKLNRRNVLKAINTWAISVVRYSAAFLRWSRLQLEIDRRMRKLLTIHNGFHPKSNADRLYLSRSKGGRGLLWVHNTVETTILGLTNYVRNSKERLLLTAHVTEED